MKAEFPHISLKSLTAVEVKHIGKRSGLSIRETLTRLRDSGLDSLPVVAPRYWWTASGTGSAEVRSPARSTFIHRTAHQLDIPTAVLFGTVETMADRITHLHL